MTIQLSTLGYQVLEAALIGGNIVAILQQKAARAKAIADLNIAAGVLSFNPLTFLSGIPINVITQEAYTFQAEVAKNPVENGVKMSDHVILNPIKVDISFEVTNINDLDQQYIFGLLTTMWSERKLTTLQTEHAQIPNMVMTSLPIINSLPHWGRLKCRATFEQMNMITIEQKTEMIEKTAVSDEFGNVEINQSALPSLSVGTAAATVLKTITAGLF